MNKSFRHVGKLEKKDINVTTRAGNNFLLIIALTNMRASEGSDKGHEREREREGENKEE